MPGDLLDPKAQRISSAEMIEKLCEIEPRPWAEYGKSGKPITQNKLARLLKPLGVAPRNSGSAPTTPGDTCAASSRRLSSAICRKGGFKPKHRNKCRKHGHFWHFSNRNKPNPVSV